jgi:biopolymer transport protein ExbD
MAAKANSESSDDIVSDINIVPLVDIILVVLIIFMVTSQVSSNQQKLDVDLPQASTGLPEESKSLRVVLNLKGEIFVDGQAMGEYQLKEYIVEAMKENPNINGILVADQGINYGEAVRVLDWMQSSGLKDVSISVGGVL